MKKKQEDTTSHQLTGLTDQLSMMTHQYEDVVTTLDDLKGRHSDLHSQHQQLSFDCKNLCEKELESKAHISALDQG